MDQSEQIFLGELTKRMGFGVSAPQRGMVKVSRFAMVWYLMKTGFFLTQPLQTFNAMAHLVDMKGSLGEASGHFLAGWQRTIMPTDADRAAVNWAVKNEYLDPTSSHLMDDYNAAYPTRLFLKTSGTIEREMVRTPAFLMFEHALRDTISDPEKRYEAAAEKMAFSMSMTNRSNSPLIWEKLGIVGQGMRQLKSYSTNIFGQFAYLIQNAAERKQFKPLATFLGTEALMGGVKGLVLVPEATAAILAYNALTSSNVQTPEEWMLTSPTVDKVLGHSKTAATYGLASTLSGRDISNQVGNPSGFNYFDPIPFRFALQIAEPNIKYAVALAQNQLTDDIRLQTWLANTPTALHEAIRNWFTKDGQMVPNPGMNMKGSYQRTPEQKVISSVSGTKAIEETQADALQRFFKRHEQRLTQNRSNTLNSMVDDIFNGNGVDPDKIMSYMSQGGAPSSLSSDLKTTMMQRHRMDIYNSIINKSKSPQQAQRLMDVQPYLQNIPPSATGGATTDEEGWENPK
jgi:hypothetical protein